MAGQSERPVRWKTGVTPPRPQQTLASSLEDAPLSADGPSSLNVKLGTIHLPSGLRWHKLRPTWHVLRLAMHVTISGELSASKKPAVYWGTLIGVHTHRLAVLHLDGVHARGCCRQCGSAASHELSMPARTSPLRPKWNKEHRLNDGANGPCAVGECSTTVRDGQSVRS